MPFLCYSQLLGEIRLLSDYGALCLVRRRHLFADRGIVERIVDAQAPDIAYKPRSPEGIASLPEGCTDEDEEKQGITLTTTCAGIIDVEQRSDEQAEKTVGNNKHYIASTTRVVSCQVFHCVTRIACPHIFARIQHTIVINVDIAEDAVVACETFFLIWLQALYYLLVYEIVTVIIVKRDEVYRNNNYQRNNATLHYQAHATQVVEHIAYSHQHITCQRQREEHHNAKAYDADVLVVKAIGKKEERRHHTKMARLNKWSAISKHVTSC